MTAAADPAGARERTLFGHPAGLYVLFFAEMWERFSYYGMRALLTLYMVKYWRFTDGEAAGVYGDYTGLVWFTPILGGYLADRYLGLRKAIVLGGALMVVGHALMAVDALSTFYAALVLLVIGNGFFKPNISTFVGQLYAPGDPRRDAGFTIFYMGINTGSWLAGLICPSLGQSKGADGVEHWHWGFGAAAIGMTLGLIVFVWGQRFMQGKGIAPAHAAAPKPAAAAASPVRLASSSERLALALVALVGVAFAAYSAYRDGTYRLEKDVWVARDAFSPLSAARGALWPLAGTIVAEIYAFLMFRCRGADRGRVNAIFLISAFVVIFWAAFEQAGSSLTLFADRYTRLELLGVDFKSGHFQQVNSLAVILLAPVFSWIWLRMARLGREPSTMGKMALGLVFDAAGMGIMVLAARASMNGERVSPMWLGACYVLQSCGELCVSPIGLSLVTKIAPAGYAAMLMGVFFLSNAFANKVAGIAASNIENYPLTTVFGWIAAVPFVAAFVLLGVAPVLRRWMGAVK